MPILSISTFAFTYTFKFFGFFWVFICALSYTFNVGYLFIYYGFWVFFFLVSCLERNLYKKYFLEGFVVFFAWINLDIVFQQYSIFQEWCEMGWQLMISYIENNILSCACMPMGSSIYEVYLVYGVSPMLTTHVHDISTI
jgi:hypothetical protein